MAWWKPHGRIRGSVKAHEAKAHGRAGRRADDRFAVAEGIAESVEERTEPARLSRTGVPAKKMR